MPKKGPISGGIQIMASRSVLLASAGYDGVIRFWDVSGGHTKRTIKYEDSQDAKVRPVSSRLPGVIGSRFIRVRFLPMDP